MDVFMLLLPPKQTICSPTFQMAMSNAYSNTAQGQPYNLPVRVRCILKYSLQSGLSLTFVAINEDNLEDETSTISELPFAPQELNVDTVFKRDRVENVVNQFLETIVCFLRSYNLAPLPAISYTLAHRFPPGSKNSYYDMIRTSGVRNQHAWETYEHTHLRDTPPNKCASDTIYRVGVPVLRRLPNSDAHHHETLIYANV